MRMLGNRVLVKANPGAAMTKGGLALPAASQDKPTTGKVIAKGADQLYATAADASIPIKVEIGDTVLFIPGAGDDIVIDEEKYKIILGPALIGVLEEGEKANVLQRFDS